MANDNFVMQPIHVKWLQKLTAYICAQKNVMNISQKWHFLREIGCITFKIGFETEKPQPGILVRKKMSVVSPNYSFFASKVWQNYAAHIFRHRTTFKALCSQITFLQNYFEVSWILTFLKCHFQKIFRISLQSIFGG